MTQDLKDSFLDYLACERNYSACTICSYREDLNAFEKFFHGLEEALSWECLDADIVRQWVVTLMEQGYKETSVNRRLSAVRSFYRYALKRRLVQTDPTHLVSGPKKRKSLPSFVKEKEMDRLLEKENFAEGFEGVRDRLILSTFYQTGVRLSELTGMNIGDVDLSRMQMHVFGKRRKERIIPFGEDLLEQIKEYMTLYGQYAIPEVWQPFFLTEKGRRVSNATVAKMVRNYLSQVTTLKKRSPHVLRHTFATVMLNHNADLESVKELLGHESLSTTEIYTHTTFEEMKQIYKLAHPRA